MSAEAARPDSGCVAGATNTSDPSPSATESGQDDSGDLRAEQERIKARRQRERELARVLDPAAFDDMASIPTARRRERQLDALLFASAAISDGYRRVVEDDDTPAAMVREFHEAFGVAIDQHASGELRHLRADLLGEECGEARYALLAEDLHAIAKELADVVIVAYGSAISLGINLDEAVRLVHASNMSNLGDDGRPVLRADGKVLKGPNYSPPDMSRAVVRALREGQA